MVAQQTTGKAGHLIKQPLWRLAMRRMLHARQQCDVNRTVAFLLGNLDLTYRTVLILRTLHDQHRHSDIGEHIGNVEATEIRVEPGIVPAPKGRIDVGMVASEARA